MSDILIIGGGISGLLTARELAKATDARITLVEMSEPGRESSWAGGGILTPLYPWRQPTAITVLANWSQAVYPQLCQELREETGDDPEYAITGMTILDDEQRDVALAWAKRHHLAIETCTSAELEALEPGLEPPGAQALWLPWVAQVRNPRLLRALGRALARRIEVREREEVIELVIERDRLVGVRTTRGTLQTACAIVCTGAWTARLLEKIGTAPAIRPVRGQMMLFHAAPGQIRHVTLYRERYVIPRQDGHVLVGGSVEEAGFEKLPTAEIKEALYQAAVELFPLLRRVPIVDHWAGLRPGSPRGIPYICPYPEVAGLFLNAGHFHHGFVIGPAAARLTADLVLGRSPIVAPQPYGLDADRSAP